MYVLYRVYDIAGRYFCNLYVASFFFKSSTRYCGSKEEEKPFALSYIRCPWFLSHITGCSCFLGHTTGCSCFLSHNTGCSSYPALFLCARYNYSARYPVISFFAHPLDLKRVPVPGTFFAQQFHISRVSPSRLCLHYLRSLVISIIIQLTLHLYLINFALAPSYLQIHIVCICISLLTRLYVVSLRI